jgi:cytochrome c553
MKIRIAAVILMAAFSSMAWADDGGALYKTKCMMCHGDKGQGKPPMAPKVAGTAKSTDQIVALLTKGGAAKGKHVKAIDGITGDQAKALAEFVKSLK